MELDLDSDVMCFGHGSPMFSSPKEAVRRYLESDEIWSRLEQLIFGGRGDSLVEASTHSLQRK